MRAIVGGGSKSMAKMENKARLGSGGFLGRLGFFGTCKYWRLNINAKYVFFLFFHHHKHQTFVYEHDLLKYLKNWVTIWAPRC